MTGHSPTELEKDWSLEDVNWVLATSHSRNLARLQLAKQFKVSPNDVILPTAFDVRLTREEVEKKRQSKRKKRQLKKDGDINNRDRQTAL